MDIIISNSSAKPIYEQISTQIKELILTGGLSEGERLPSIRALASDLRVSVITTQRAYEDLEGQGFIDTVQGKGSYVAGGNAEIIREERLREVEALLGQAIAKARSTGLADDRLHDMLTLLQESED
ncbi:transcriptional regulator, GntR family [Coriobacterium glomerans PW2]|uniref:Transcriptional regulator, GntR family n=1 Tax=Coriobacterium glomerans (strain ATCC 49209 / DSM 20642 / JCM 10262 / PW2) TaxID=700015 RepID=F2NA30_CORGP|nr:GntR family transcriptional regulator [Coriobacterium glomerans]AEB06424.1 transcriptional regulator, GntR family [Coriobacterium glomerans PW2]